ncbi:MAG: glycosyltransferase family 1 protein, partial [Mariprofundales bacterium]
SLHLDRLPHGVSIVPAPAGLDNPVRRAIWEQTQLAKMLRTTGAEIYFSPAGLLPSGIPDDVATVVTFQNMLPFSHAQRARYPMGYRRVRDWLLERGFRRSMRRADLVIFISQYARNFIESTLNFSALSRRVVIPHGLDDMFRYRPNAPALPRPSQLPVGDYVLYVSFIDHYKAQLEVIQGFARFRQRGGGGVLVLAGAEYPPYGRLVRQEIDRLGLQGAVILVGNLPHHTLPALYQHARWIVFASECENCPNILMESLASHRPVLCSHAQPMPEFAGDAALYFDARDPDSLVEAMLQLQNSSELEQQLADLAVSQVSTYDWRDTAMKTWSAIRQAGERKGACASL